MASWLLPLLRDLGFFAVAVAAIGWIARTGVQALIARDIEKFKSSLQDETEKLRHTLSLQALEHQVRFSDLHMRRAKLICKFHLTLQDALGKSRAFVSPAQESKDRQKELGREAGEAIRQLFLIERRLRIFLPSDLAERAHAGIVSLDTEWFRAHIAYQDASETDANPYFGVFRESFGESFGRLNKFAPQLLSDLEREFRQLIGVEPFPPSAKDRGMSCSAGH